MFTVDLAFSIGFAGSTAIGAGFSTGFTGSPLSTSAGLDPNPKNPLTLSTTPSPDDIRPIVFFTMSTFCTSVFLGFNLSVASLVKSAIPLSAALAPFNAKLNPSDPNIPLTAPSIATDILSAVLAS